MLTGTERMLTTGTVLYRKDGVASPSSLPERYRYAIFFFFHKRLISILVVFTIYYRSVPNQFFSFFCSKKSDDSTYRIKYHTMTTGTVHHHLISVKEMSPFLFQGIKKKYYLIL